ncbi:MAG: hypothetical protein ACP5QU_07430 [Anaerolineae bacterium]
MYRLVGWFCIFFLLMACAPTGQNPATQVAVALTATSAAPTATLLPSQTPSLTATSLPTWTATQTFTPTVTFTPTITATATFAFPTVTVNKQAHCRYGPSVAYLHAADLYPGDTGTVRGRFIYSRWLFVKFDKLHYFCWVAPSVVDVVGDISRIAYQEVNLKVIPSTLYKPPKNVQAVRNGNRVTITWDRVKMTADDDRGYFLELFVCQDGNLIWWTDSYPDQFTTTYTVRDDPGCSQPSSGKLYTVEKHGYTDPVIIPWPAP